MAVKIFRHTSLSPNRVLAGDAVEFDIRITVDEGFLSRGSALVFDMPGMMGQSRPTVYMQEMSGYMEVMISNPDIIYEKKVFDIEADEYVEGKSKSFMGWGQRFFVIKFIDGQPHPGDEIVVKWGYTRVGMGPGTNITTVAPMQENYTHIYLRYFYEADRALPDLGRELKGNQRPIPDWQDTLTFRIMPREASYIRSISRVNGETDVLIRDRFHNPCLIDDAKKYIKNSAPGRFNHFGTLVLNDEDTSRSPSGVREFIEGQIPIFSTPTVNSVYKGYNIYFGDLHCHSAISNDCIERERMEIRPDEMLDFLKNAMSLDFAAIADHHQPWDIERNKIGADNWTESQKAAEEHNSPGEFVAFPALEYRDVRGDTVVVFGNDADYAILDNPEFNNVNALWDGLKGMDYITIPHFHNPGAMQDDTWYECPYPDTENVLEIFSCHGSYELPREETLERKIPDIKHYRPDRNAKYFLQKGYYYGFMCNSDNHKGNPGSNGLTAVFAKDLSRKSIFEAIRQRRCYGTTNARIKLIFTIDDNIMGSILNMINEGKVYIKAEGEQTIKALDVYKNGEPFKRFYPKNKRFTTEFVIDKNETASYYVRVIQIDNHMAWSSPIWIL